MKLILIGSHLCQDTLYALNKLKDYELKILEIKNGETNLISYSKNKNQIKSYL